MKLKFKDIVLALFLSVCLLIILDIISTAVIPALGFHKFKLTFNVLIILFLGFYIDSPYLPIFILIIQSFHSVFTIEGWAYGTFTGVIISLLLGQLKDLLHFRSTLLTVFITFIFQYLWFLIVSGLIYFRMGNLNYILERFWNFIPESIVLSLCAPFFFSILERIWRIGNRENHPERVDV